MVVGQGRLPAAMVVGQRASGSEGDGAWTTSGSDGGGAGAAPGSDSGGAVTSSGSLYR